MSAYPTKRGKTLFIAIPVALALSLLIILNPVPTRVYAVDVFGTLRDPGDGAFIAGHRGDRSAAPENTMPAFDLAIAGPMEFVETDVQLTRDNVPMLMHDVTLDRTTDGSGTVAEHTAAELGRLDAGKWYGKAFAGTRIPTLDAFLKRLAVSDKKALVELKFGWSADQLRGIIALIDERKVGGKVVLQSFSLETLANLQIVAPQRPRIMLVRELPADPVPMAHRFGVIAIATTSIAVAAAPEAVARLHSESLGIICYTLNSQETWAEVRDRGVDGIITDMPSDLDSWLASTTPGT